MPLQGEGLYTLVPRALPWAGNWLPFQGARGEGCGGPARAESPTSSEPRATPWVNVRTAPAPCKGKSNKQPFAHTFALTGRRALYSGTQGVALGWELAALSGRSRRRFELIEFLQRGCGAAPQFIVGLRRRNNELNELTNCCAARRRGIAPEGGAYSRIGACPYLRHSSSILAAAPVRGAYRGRGLPRNICRDMSPLQGRGS